MEPRWLTSRELAAWTRLASVLELLPSALDAQLRGDASLTHFDYRVLAILSETEGQVMQMSHLAAATNATLPRASHVVQRLEARGYVQREHSPTDRRARHVSLTRLGKEKIKASAPGHVENVREHVLDALTPDQVNQVAQISEQLLLRLDKNAALRPIYGRYPLPDSGAEDAPTEDGSTG